MEYKNIEPVNNYQTSTIEPHQISKYKYLSQNMPPDYTRVTSGRKNLQSKELLNS